MPLCGHNCRQVIQLAGKRFILGVFVFLFSLAILVHIVPRGNFECKLSMSNFSTDCLSSIPYSPSWPTTAVRITRDNFVFFSEEYVYKVGTNEVISIFFDGEKSNWTKELDISPQCAIWGEERRVTLPRDTNRLRHSIKYKHGSCLGENSRPEEVNLGSVKALSGSLEIAYYFIPLDKGCWVFWPEPVFGGEIEPRRIEASCSCSLERILENIGRDIERLNFTAVEDFGKWQKGPVEVVFSRLYTRNDEYLYIECEKIKGLGLARILMVKGSKNVVLPYPTLLVEKNQRKSED